MRATSKPIPFDPNTATLVAAYDNIGPSFYTNFHLVSERLYVTQHGKWFLEGQGGALTRCGRIGGEASAIAPLNRSEAYDWLKRRGKTDAILRYF